MSGGENMRSLVRKQQTWLHRRGSRKRITRRVRVLVVTACTAIVAAIFAHPWKSPEIIDHVPPLMADDSFLMEFFNTAKCNRDAWLQEEVLMENLIAPDGLTMDPFTGSIFFSEEDTARIIRRDPDGVSEVIIDTRTPIMQARGGELVPTSPLLSPEGIAFDPSGRLYVVEDVPGGRLIVFDLPGYQNPGAMQGVVVPFPKPAEGYAWESVAVGPQGELLMAGSNLEGFINDRKVAKIYSGAILYRDVNGQWWMPIFRELESFSAACFGPEGHNAYFTSELMGYTGCIDLKTHFVKTWYSDATHASPEGITALPDGTAVVATEDGKLIRVDPHDCLNVEVYDFGTNIESVYWDGARSRLLVTSDGTGSLRALNEVHFNATTKIQGELLFQETVFDVEVPSLCPDYLAGLLRRCGYDDRNPHGKMSFSNFVYNVALFAVDAEARLMPSSDPIRDPIKHVQFAIFSPRFFGVDLKELAGPGSGFAAVHASGDISSTEMHKRSIMHINVMEGQFTAFAPNNVTLPYPFAYRLTQDGIASVSFMGFGETPDYHIMMNMKDPSQAYMVVMHTDGAYQQYRLALPPGKDIQHWVIGLKRENPETWARMEEGNQPRSVVPLQASL